ncbi:MAG: excinuclease ABC subunit UvrC [Nitrospirae bacterium]|jgi:excinuclease ABC subunit C|nr:excinuclease ABC subunit UvrC [Nitrospirota bacterium]
MLKKISRLPSNPGVYIFKDTKEKVLYVGKAKNLRNRLKSYFQKSSQLDARKTAMMKDVREFTYIVTGNELEAFILEANLVKQLKPRFNIILRDDKNYPYLKLTVNEEWPGLEVVRKIKKDGALYFGPYVPAGSMWEILAFIRRNFQIRDCRYPLDKPMRPCVQYQMGKCPGPCAGLISREEYLKLIEEVRLFLSGEKRDLMDGLKKKMIKLSDEMRFEDAARIRDRIRALEKAWESQKIVSPELEDIDVIGFYRDNSEASFNVFLIRNGVMTGSKDFFIKRAGLVSESDLVNIFITQFYTNEIIPPYEIILPVLPEELKSLEIWLSQRKEEPVKITVPGSGKKKELLNMASENAKLAYRSKKEMNTEELLNDIKDKLKLEETPEDIGAFDVSTISGKEAAGSFVYWSGGGFKKDFYRRLKIKTVGSKDDYSMTEEIIERIINNLEGVLPCLVIIDGGKGHLEIAKKVMDKNITALKKAPALISIAKDPDRAYLAHSDVIVKLEDRSRSSLLLKRIRDEAHRFAIGYHRKLRDKELMKSPLEKIPGIGKKRRLELLRVFGSIENIKNATIDEISKVKGFNKKSAVVLLNELRRP